MTQHHPDLADEQAYVDRAYDCLASSREAAWRLRDLSEADLGGTFQARFERNAEVLRDWMDDARVSEHVTRTGGDTWLIDVRSSGRAAAVFEGLENISVDYALMEHARDVLCVRGDFPWDDIGAWPAIERRVLG